MIGIDAIAGLVSTVVDKIWPDANIEANAKADAIKAELTQQLQASLGQLEINKIEAGSASLFVSGWRPALGWSCVAGFGYEFVLRPIVVGVSAGFGFPIPLPGIETAVFETLLYAMLGLGSMRTVERIRGVHRI